MNIFLRKTILATCISLLAVAALPVTRAFAADEKPPQGEASKERLEKVWARQLQLLERIGKGVENSDARVAKLQEMIDKAAAAGKDVSALQAALDAFEAAMNSAQTAYEGAQAIANSHNGFDENGKVTEIEQAKTTVETMRAKMQEIKSLMKGTGEGLRAALKAFREANKPTDTQIERQRD